MLISEVDNDPVGPEIQHGERFHWYFSLVCFASVQTVLSFFQPSFDVTSHAIITTT